MPFIIHTKNTKDLEYQLIDSGDGRKLESYKGYIIDRPDPQALWPKKVDSNIWDSCDAKFFETKTGKREERGEWKVYKTLPESFSINFFKDLQAQVKLNPFKHTGIFPEQYANWKFIDEKIIERKKEKPETEIKVLNLFGYTGCASLVAAYAGASVVHVDGSKQSIAGGVLNTKKSGLENANIRWILDDAFAFVKREIRRGNTYDGIIMDPPAFGRGAKGEIWKLEENFIDFVKECTKLLSPNPLFFIVNGYSAGYSHIAYRQNIEASVSVLFPNGNVESGELLFLDTQGRYLPAGIVARWGK